MVNRRGLAYVFVVACCSGVRRGCRFLKFVLQARSPVSIGLIGGLLHTPRLILPVATALVV